MKCPKCKVQLSKKEYEEGTCEICGWERSRQNRLQARKNEKRQPKPSATLPQPPAPKAVAVIAQFEVTVHSAGYIHGQGFTVDQGDYEKSRFISSHVIVLANGEVYAGKDILNFIANDSTLSAPSKVLKVGRARLHLINETFINYLLERNEYPSRSQREQQVTDRNLNLICWLAEQAGL